MTKNTDFKRKEYNYLDKKGTTKTRQDYIETSYVNGVKNDSNELVIRPMTKEERDWLSQFTSETEHGNLNKTSQIKHEVSLIKSLRSDHRKAKKRQDIDEMLRLEPLIDEKLRFVESLRESANNFYTTEQEVREIYNRDNTRRSDVYNNAKISNNLVLYDITEYDKFSTEAISDINPENLILEHLVYVPSMKKRRK